MKWKDVRTNPGSFKTKHKENSAYSDQQPSHWSLYVTFGFNGDPHSSASSSDNTLSLSAQSHLYKLWFEHELTEESLSLPFLLSVTLQ